MFSPQLLQKVEKLKAKGWVFNYEKQGKTYEVNARNSNNGRYESVKECESISAGFEQLAGELEC